MPTLLSARRMDIEFLDLPKRHQIWRPEKNERSPGVHLSGVLAHIGESIGYFTPGEKPEELMPLLWLLGVFWEEGVFSLLPEADYQPGEVCQDGIWMTCDGLSWYDPATGEFFNDEQASVLDSSRQLLRAIEESKYTKKKYRPPEEFVDERNVRGSNWYYFQQAKGYCRGYGATIVRWHICYTNGDYSIGPITPPVYMQYVILFSKEEIERTWQMVLRNKEGATKE